MACPSLTANHHHPSIIISPQSPIQAYTDFMPANFQIPPDPATIARFPRPPISRPPSYKLDTNVDLDALERDYMKSIETYKVIPIWRHQFQGVPLVFWLVVFVMIGVVSLFIPQLPFVALALWFPLILYFIGLLIVQLAHRKRVQTLHLMKCQLAAIQQHRQNVLTQVVDCPPDLYFLHSLSSQHTHPITTILPPPPTYQKFAI